MAKISAQNFRKASCDVRFSAGCFGENKLGIKLPQNVFNVAQEVHRVLSLAGYDAFSYMSPCQNTHRLLVLFVQFQQESAVLCGRMPPTIPVELSTYPL